MRGGNLAEMDRLLRADPNFVDYVAKRSRESELEALQERVDALQRAKAALEATPIPRPSRRAYKNAKTWCATHGWSDETAQQLVAEYRRQQPLLGGVAKKSQRVAHGLRNLGQIVLG
jgi:hypothetical protein